MMVQVLIGQGEVEHDVGLELFDERDELVHVVGVHLRGVILVLVVLWSFSLRASHLALVRLAIMISSKTSLFWQHLWMATEATPPQPMMRAFPIR